MFSVKRFVGFAGLWMRKQPEVCGHKKTPWIRRSCAHTDPGALPYARDMHYLLPLVEAVPELTSYCRATSLRYVKYSTKERVEGIEPS